jgi:hypothetical protein
VLGHKTEGLDTVVEYVEKAEELGFDSAFTIDHFIITPPAYTCTWLEPMVLLAAVAARTRRMKLGPLVLVLPLRNPIYLAKMVASLDFLSGGRFILGIGVGWNKEEFDLMNVPFAERASGRAKALRSSSSFGRETTSRFKAGFSVSKIYPSNPNRCKSLIRRSGLEAGASPLSSSTDRRRLTWSLCCVG